MMLLRGSDINSKDDAILVHVFGGHIHMYIFGPLVSLVFFLDFYSLPWVSKP